MSTRLWRVAVAPDDNDSVLTTCSDLSDDALRHVVDAIGEPRAGRLVHRKPILAPPDFIAS